VKVGLAVVAVVVWFAGAGPGLASPLRVMSLDQCADQYVLALVPEATLALSPRADDPDAWMREAGRDHRRIRPTLEAAVGFRPDVVVRYWGGEPRLLARLDRGGTRVLTLSDADDFAGIRANILAVARGLDVPERGERLIARMDGRLASVGRRSTPTRPALYLTAGGFTASLRRAVAAVRRTRRARRGRAGA